MSTPEWLILAPVATVVIMAIAFVMSLVIQTTNKLLIGHFLGWDNYRAMQKEMADFRKESMEAARSKDKKQLEKVKKKQAQINAMNAKMMKPQMIQLALSFCYFPIWTLIRPIFSSRPVFILPGVGAPDLNIFGLVVPNFMIWYMMVALFLGTLLARVLRTAPTNE
ncbi:MAG: EMC3/TMCO1 family protein [Candidatus Bathyarchaeota archaeon]|nr:EMC3/TMCO1 family protein [Candidatus Termiticorpusculum sp.]